MVSWGTYLIMRLLFLAGGWFVHTSFSRRCGRLWLSRGFRLGLLGGWLLSRSVSGGGLVSRGSLDGLLLVFGWLVGHLRFAF